MLYTDVVKQCKACGQYFNPSSRHRKCPACRERTYKASFDKRCNCGKLIQQSSNKCIRCNNDDKRGVYYGRSRYITKRGYVYVKQREHPRANKVTGFVFEHTLIMEKHLGRYLLPTENVHHKNSLKYDNKINNLELWTRGQPNGSRVSDLIQHAKGILDLYGTDETKYI